jgi:hypothetical protein
MGRFISRDGVNLRSRQQTQLKNDRVTLQFLLMYETRWVATGAVRSFGDSNGHN